MRFHSNHKWLTVSAALALGMLFCFPSAAAVDGQLEWADSGQIVGWAWDTEDDGRILDVDITVTPENPEIPAQTWTVQADVLCGAESGYASHGFVCPIDWNAFTDTSFSISACVHEDDTFTPLDGVILYDISCTKPVYSSADSSSGEIPFAAPLSVSAVSANGCILGAPGSADDQTPADVIVGPELTVLDIKTDADLYTDAADPSVKYRKGASLGTHVTTGYCTCELCSGGWGRTYSGTIPQANRTVSADIRIYPIGTKLIIGDVLYTVEDIGDNVVGNHIDIYYDNHAAAEGHGKQTAEVFLAEPVTD